MLLLLLLLGSLSREVVVVMVGSSLTLRGCRVVDVAWSGYVDVAWSCLFVGGRVVLSALLSASASLLLLSLSETNIPYIQGTVPYT